jgi:membrane protease YdiL (CAAX protease family)
MTTQARRPHGAVAFFGLVLLLSVPFWILGALSDATITEALSVASLMVVAPFLAAVLLTRRSGGGRSVRALLARAVDPRLPRGARWYLPVLLLMPAAVVIEVGLLGMVGRSVPGFEVAPLVLVADLALFWFAATLEEVGWTGYATDRLLAVRGRPVTALVIGVVWALWHVPAMLEMPGEPSWAWVVLQCLNQVIVRVLIVWIYVASGGSLFAAIGLHALLNVSTMTLFPVDGSHYDPLVANVVLGVVAILIVRLWSTTTPASLPRAFGRWHRPPSRSSGDGLPDVPNTVVEQS